MYHLVARSLPGTLLFTTWEEGLACWAAVLRSVPNPVALVLMPDHVHLLHHGAVEHRLATALSGYVRWRNRHRGESGPGISPVPKAERLADDQKVQRSIRYVHLNPCRARLVTDPLAWPLSTHRDAVGLVIWPVVPRHPQPDQLHRYVSSDPTVSVQGTLLPFAGHFVPTAEQVATAVCAVTRSTPDALRRRGPVRALYLASARTLSGDTHATIGANASCSRWQVVRANRTVNASVRLVERVIGDPRFADLEPGDLRPTWRRWHLRPR